MGGGVCKTPPPFPETTPDLFSTREVCGAAFLPSAAGGGIDKIFVSALAVSEEITIFASTKPADGNKNAILLLICYQLLVFGGLSL